MRNIIPRRVSTALLGAHALIGVIFAWALYMVCFSGSLAVLADEFSRWERPGDPVIASVSPAQLADAGKKGYAAAAAQHRGFDTVYVTAPSPTLPTLSVTAAKLGIEPEAEWSVDGSGKLRPTGDAPWTEFMREHHHSFNLPDPYGSYLVGILGTLLIAGLISGLIAHRRIFRDAFRLRWGGSKRRSNADLHNRIGVWAFPFHLIVSLTGSLLGLAGLIIGVLALVAFRGDQDKAIAALTGPQPTADMRPAPLPDVLPMMRTIAARAPGTDEVSLVFQHVGTRGQLVTIYTSAPGHLTRAEAWTFAPDGRLLDKAGFTDGSLGMRIYGMITPLHYGTYGGLPLKIVYMLLGASLTTLVASGLAVWLARRREQGRAAPRREKLWTGLVWGQPIAFSLSALLAIGWGLPPIWTYWITAAAIGATALAGKPADRMARDLRWATASLLAALALAHMMVRGSVLAGIDITLLLLAGLLIAPATGKAASNRRSMATKSLVGDI